MTSVSSFTHLISIGCLAALAISEAPPAFAAVCAARSSTNSVQQGSSLPPELETQKQAAAAVALEPFEGTRRTIADLKIELIPVSPGRFIQGTLRPDPLCTDEHAGFVVITCGYWLGQTEVTQRQWKAVMGKTQKEQMAGNPLAEDVGLGDKLPVYLVSWHDAMEFCRRLTERERTAGRLPPGYRFSLPTEAQWEYAARAGVTEADVDVGADKICYIGNSGRKPKPVATRPPNDWGFHDMSGNVAEWCLDWYAAYPTHLRVDPLGASAGEKRVDRGGSFAAHLGVCRPAARGSTLPTGTWPDLGFRVALVLDSKVADVAKKN